ncbi:MAG: ATP-binding protein [Cyanobacteria bacterium P01_E01_bin.6]
MDKGNFSGSAQITDEGIKKHFKSYESIQAIYEIVWNGLDAKANNVDIKVIYNPLGGLDHVTILDDGEGIDIDNIEDKFGKFNESSKRHDDDKHGSHGKGRLAFHKLGDVAVWYTRRGQRHVKITIRSDEIKKYKGSDIAEAEQHVLLKAYDAGTCVELHNCSNRNLPENDDLADSLGTEFGWFLALNSTKKIRLNGKEIKTPEHDINEANFEIDGYKFAAKIIRWNEKPSSEKSYNYLIHKDFRTVRKELSKFNNKFKFYITTFVFSRWVDNYIPDILELDQRAIDQRKIYNKLMYHLQDLQREVHKTFLRNYVDNEINKYDEKGYFPSYKNLDHKYAEWRKNNTKSVLRDIYIADPIIFNRLNERQAKILIRLLDAVLVSNENNSLFDVLDGVLDLDEENISLLANQLEKVTFENIVSTIETLQKREAAVSKIKEIMANRYDEVLETPDLQKIIESNTWLFGPQYTILGAEEDDFTSIAKKLRDSIRGIDDITDSDIEEGSKLEGARKQVDLFLARKMATYNFANEPVYKCVVLEIKRPSVSLNKKHLHQLDEYAEIIAKHTAFSSNRMNFELILVGRKISKDDHQIKSRLGNLKHSGEYGLVSDGDDRIKCYVKDWFTIFDEFELSNKYLLENLNTRLEDFSDQPTGEMVEDLQLKTA